jgi:hypothetical protein
LRKDKLRKLRREMDLHYNDGYIPLDKTEDGT